MLEPPSHTTDFDFYVEAICASIGKKKKYNILWSLCSTLIFCCLQLLMCKELWAVDFWDSCCTWMLPSGEERCCPLPCPREHQAHYTGWDKSSTNNISEDRSHRQGKDALETKLEGLCVSHVCDFLIYFVIIFCFYFKTCTWAMPSLLAQGNRLSQPRKSQQLGVQRPTFHPHEQVCEGQCAVASRPFRGLQGSSLCSTSSVAALLVTPSALSLPVHRRWGQELLLVIHRF